MSRIVCVIIIMFCIQPGGVAGLSCEQQYTNIFDTPCGKIYEALDKKEENDKKVDFFRVWKKYEQQCSETGEYQVYRADVLQARGKHKEAQSIVKKIIHEKGQKHDVRAAYAILIQSLLSENKKLDEKLHEAKEVAMECIIRYPYWYRGYLDYGTVLVHQNKFEEGKKYIDKSISLQDSYSEPYGILTIIYHLHYKDAAMAVKMYKKGLLKKQYIPLLGIPNTTISVVKCAMNQKDYKTAVWVLEKEKELFPNFSETEWYKNLSNKVNAYFKQNHITEVFTAEEKEALKADRLDVLEILGR